MCIFSKKNLQDQATSATIIMGISVKVGGSILAWALVGLDNSVGRAATAAYLTMYTLVANNIPYKINNNSNNNNALQHQQQQHPECK